MKLSKSFRSNLIFIGIVVLLLFTPVGGIIKEQVSKLWMSSPEIIETNTELVKIENYNWHLKGVNTSSYNFKEASEKVVIINFWATWCPPCRAEMPSFQNLYNDYKDKVVFLFVTDENSNEVVTFLQKHNYSIPVYNEFSSTPNDFNVSSIPATYVLNKKGEIVVDLIGAADWYSDDFRETLDDLLAN